MKIYGTYRFKDKDPIIDIIRTCIDIYAALREIQVPQAIEELAKTSNVSESTIYKWLAGETISPRVCTAFAVVRATGEKISIGKTILGGHHRYRVIPGGKKVAS